LKAQLAGVITVATYKRNQYNPETGCDDVGDLLKLLAEVVGKE
jgi:hypothetical protein